MSGSNQRLGPAEPQVKAMPAAATAHEMCSIYLENTLRWLICMWRILYGCHGCGHYLEKQKEALT